MFTCMCVCVCVCVCLNVHVCVWLCIHTHRSISSLGSTQSSEAPRVTAMEADRLINGASVQPAAIWADWGCWEYGSHPPVALNTLIGPG